MGVSCMHSSCDVYDKKSTSPNPNPANFRIIWDQCFEIGHMTILTVEYPDCTKYSKLKILVCEHLELDDFKDVNCLDPHFGNHFDGLIARFRGDVKGMNNAKLFCESKVGIK